MADQVFCPLPLLPPQHTFSYACIATPTPHPSHPPTTRASLCPHLSPPAASSPQRSIPIYSLQPLHPRPPDPMTLSKSPIPPLLNLSSHWQ